MNLSAQATKLRDRATERIRARVRVRARVAAAIAAGLALSLADTPLDLPDRTPPAELEQLLWDDPERIPGLYRAWGAHLASLDADRPRLLDYAAQVASHRARRLVGGDPVSAVDDVQLDLLLAMLQIDPERFFENARFRRDVLPSWAPLRDILPRRLRMEMVERLASRGLDDFDALETVAWEWGLVPRRSAERRVPATGSSRNSSRATTPGRAAGRTHGDELDPIEASLFSLPAFLDPIAASRLLVAVRAASPGRRILVLADESQSRLLRRTLLRYRGGAETAQAVTFLPTLGVPFSPWPRDPLTLTWRGDRLHVVLRGDMALGAGPHGREADRFMGRALVQSLPPDLDARWGEPTWHRAALPFHNGQILGAEGTSWVSVHSLEPRILEILGLERLPVGRFAGDDGRRYLEAARTAAEELAGLRDSAVRFVHALPPDDAAGPARAEALGRLAGGAGVDLDSVLTLLPARRSARHSAEAPVALVADLDLGSDLLRRTAPADLAGLEIYGLPDDEPDRSPAERLLRGHETPAARAFDLFLEQIAGHLASEGLEVRRLPILRIDPAGMARTDPDRPDRGDPAPFLVNWNNVVLERPAARRDLAHEVLAEGFASGLAPGDAAARAVFEEAGVRLRLYPPLVESVVRGGGFRCASQHVRRPPSLDAAPP